MDIDPELLGELKNRATGVLSALAILAGLAAPVVRPEFITPLTIVIYVETVLILLLVTNIGVLLVRVSEDRNLHEWTLPLRRNPVNVENKQLHVEISPDDPDHVEHEYVVTPVFDEPVDEFKALIGSDRDLTWTDLDVQVEGGTVDSEAYERRDWGGMTRFIFPIRFSAVSGDNYREFSYSYDVDAFDVRSDTAYTVIRSLTKRAIIDITFPEGWRPDDYNVYEGVGDEELLLGSDDIVERRENGQWRIRWERANPALEAYFRLEYSAVPAGD